MAVFIGLWILAIILTPFFEAWESKDEKPASRHDLDESGNFRNLI